MPIISMLSEFIKINMILVDLFCIELCNYFSSFCNGRSLRFLVQISLTLLGLIPIFWIFLMNYIRERTSSTIKMAAQIVEERFKVSKGDLVLFTRSDIFNFLKDRVENDKNIKDYDRKLGFYENYNQEFHHYFKIAFYSIFLAFLLFLITFFSQAFLCTFCCLKNILLFVGLFAFFAGVFCFFCLIHNCIIFLGKEIKDDEIK